MTSVNITFNCGCGFSTKIMTEAVEHADTTEHTLSVHGEVRYTASK